MTGAGRAGEDPRAVAAALNNAEWCDLVCRTHGAVTTFRADAWVTAMRSPPAFPDAITLRASAVADDLLQRIDTSAGCSVKDSFASLNLSNYGFAILFDAVWTHRPVVTRAAVGALPWRVVETVDELRAWATAHGGGAVFRPDLLHDPSVAVLVAIDADGKVAAGAVGNRGRSVVGLSNLFGVSTEPDETWAGAVAALSAKFPALPIVGYERGTDLAAAYRAGFTGVGRLRVWRKA